MEDDNGLELSLGLSLGGSSGKSKGRDATADPRVEESSSKDSVTVSDVRFVHFFQTNPENKDPSGKQRHEPVTQPYGNFWRELGNSSAPMTDGSNDSISRQSQVPRYKDMWISHNKGNSPEEEKPSLSKRRLLSEETSFQKKHQRVSDQVEALGRSPDDGVKNTPISISTDDGSTGENEDAAESEAEGSNSTLVAQREDSAKGSVVNRGTDKKGSVDPAGVFQKQPSFSGSESSSGKVASGTSLSFQAANVVSVPYQVPGQVPGTPSMTTVTTFPSASAVQLRPPASNMPVVQATNGSNLQMAFGYSAVQLPTLESCSSWAFGAPPQTVSSFIAKDIGEGAGDQHAEHGMKKSQEAGASSSAHAEDEKKADKTLFRPTDPGNKSVIEGLSLMGSAIRPGVAQNVKFGGCGSYPDLPWVSATGSGPNGKTISGVTYKYGINQLKIVCACHGSHMSPEEFVQHANADAPGPENSTNLPAFPVGNQAASAQH